MAGKLDSHAVCELRSGLIVVRRQSSRAHCRQLPAERVNGVQWARTVEPIQPHRSSGGRQARVPFAPGFNGECGEPGVLDEVADDDGFQTSLVLGVVFGISSKGVDQDADVRQDQVRPSMRSRSVALSLRSTPGSVPLPGGRAQAGLHRDERLCACVKAY